MLCDLDEKAQFNLSDLRLPRGRALMMITGRAQRQQIREKRAQRATSEQSDTRFLRTRHRLLKFNHGIWKESPGFYGARARRAAENGLSLSYNLPIDNRNLYVCSRWKKRRAAAIGFAFASRLHETSDVSRALIIGCALGLNRARPPPVKMKMFTIEFSFLSPVSTSIGFFYTARAY